MTAPEDYILPQYWRPKPGEKVEIRFITAEERWGPYYHYREGERMPTDMGHERMRWSGMRHSQLATRLNKITVHEKLWNFMRMCGEYWNDPARNGRVLCALARARAERLGFQDLVAFAGGVIANHEVSAREEARIAARTEERRLRDPWTTQDVVDPEARAYNRVEERLRGLAVHVTRHPNGQFAVCTCRMCHSVAVNVGLHNHAAQSFGERLREAERMVRAHFDVCPVAVAKAEPPKPKIRVIRMGGKK